MATKQFGFSQLGFGQIGRRQAGRRIFGACHIRLGRLRRGILSWWFDLHIPRRPRLDRGCGQRVERGRLGRNHIGSWRPCRRRSIGYRRRGCHRRARRGGRSRRNQRHQGDIGADADPLQHHDARADGVSARPSLSASSRAASRPASERLRKSEQRTRGVAGADEHSVAGEGGDRRIDAFDQTQQAFDQRHRPADRLCRGDQNAVTAIGEFKPGAAAGDEAAERRAEAAQPLQPDRAVRGQPPGKLRHLASQRIRRAESLLASAAAWGAPNSAAPTGLAHNRRLPSTDQSHAGKARCGVHRQPGIADASQLEFRVVHRVTWPDGIPVALDGRRGDREFSTSPAAALTDR